MKELFLNKIKDFKNDKYLIRALFFALLNMGIIFLIFGFQKYSDTSGYIDAIHFFQGQETQVDLRWLLRPLGAIFASPFQFLGQGAGLIVQNVIFYLFSSVLIFKITDLIFHNKRQAFFASVFFVTATPVIESGLAYLTDMGAWFFYLFSLFLTLFYFKTKKTGLVIANGFFSGVGVLMKENAGLGALFFGLMILFSKGFKMKEKIFRIAQFAVFFLIPIMILQILMYKYFHFTSLDWYIENAPGLEGESFFLVSLRYLGQLLRILGILWPFAFIAIWKELKERNWERIKIYLALIPSSFSFFLWTVGGSGRVVFIFAPLGILLASYGLIYLEEKLGKKRAIPMLVLLFLALLVSNYCFCWFNSSVPFVDVIVKFLDIL